MKKLYRGEAVEVLEQSGSLSKIVDSHGNEFSVRTEKLKDIKPTKAEKYADHVGPSLLSRSTLEESMSRAFGHDIPHLSWIGAKTFSQHGSSRRNCSGNAQEHGEANKTNLLRTAADLATIENMTTPPLLTDGK